MDDGRWTKDDGRIAAATGGSYKGATLVQWQAELVCRRLANPVVTPHLRPPHDALHRVQV